MILYYKFGENGLKKKTHFFYFYQFQLILNQNKVKYSHDKC